MREVKDEQALPFDSEHPSRIRWDWVRSKTDPTVLIHCNSGDCFRRRDGAKWEYPAYKVERSDINSAWGSVRMNTAPEDHATYSPASKLSAA